MSGSSNTQSTQSSTPDFAPQTGALTTAFNTANNALTQAQGATAPTNYTAQFTPSQLSTFTDMLNYAGNNGLPTSSANAATANTAAGTNATQGALYGLNSFNPSSTNNPNAITNAASQYVAGQNIPAQVAQAMQSADETARDVTLPGIEQSAATGGNTDSSRTGIAQGIVERGLAENAANLSGSLSSQAYQNAENLASNNANADNTAALSALTNEGNIGNAATNTGVNAGTSSINDQGTLYSLAENAGQGQQAANQANLTNQEQQYQAAVNDPFAALNNYYNIVGANNWGSTTTGNSTTTTTPSAWQVIGGLLGAAGGGLNTAGGLGWKPFAA